MMTSRSEYRLLHRQDNADIRLSHLGLRIGLISEECHNAVLEKYAAVDKEIERLENTFVPPTEALCEMLINKGTPPPNSGISLATLLRRPQVEYGDLAPFDANLPELPQVVTEQVEIKLKYAGYIDRQLKQVKEFGKMESRKLPKNMDYEAVQGLRIEARQKLTKIRPENFGQASRISGVSPADVAALMVFVESRKQNREQE